VTTYFLFGHAIPPNLQGSALYHLQVSVDEQRSRWNHDVPESTFHLPFPAGTHVVDELRNVTYVTGSLDIGTNLDELAKDAQFVRRYAGPRSETHEPESRQVSRLTFVGFGIVALGLLPLIIWMRYRRLAA
jgi:hypothetical protein